MSYIGRMKVFAGALIALVGLFSMVCSGASEMPEMPCTFTTEYVETMTYRATTSPMRRLYGALRSNVPVIRVAAQEALKKAALSGNGNDDDLPRLRDYEYHLMWYMIEDRAGSQVQDNSTFIWEAPSTFTLINPFFDRFTCVKLVSSETPAIHCPQFADRKEVKHDRVEECPNTPGKQCDVWTWWSYDYSESQEAYMYKGTNILDLVNIENEDYSLREDFLHMNTTKPDSSYFKPPKTIPCTDIASPPSNTKQTWSSKSYPGKKFRVTSMGNMLNQPHQFYYGKKPASRPIRAVPDSFDARQQWPQCDTIKAIRDQGRCGSCWAFGAAESFGDRYCIATGHSMTFSPQHLVDCYEDDDGCEGGILDLTWYALVKQGIVSDECKPYTAETHDCSYECNDTKHSALKLYYAKNAYSTFVPFQYEKTVRAIQEEIMANGPVEAAFYVLSDFMSYSGGVYQRTAGAEYQGGHAIKIIGWGVDEDTKVPYWTVANSWGEDWGEKGFFRIRRGTNECGIESEIATGLIKG